MIIEVPCLKDPLLSLYDCPAYQQFYYQTQHPFVYSAPSLARLLGHAVLEIVEEIAFQRYGIENHLHWLSRGEPGGDASLREIFSGLDDDYRNAVELTGDTDTVIMVAKKN